MVRHGMKTPLVQAVLDYVNENTARFHMPGHKGGKLVSPSCFNLSWSYDLTEIPGTDNLHAPAGAVKEAQELAARAFGSDACFFLVNGTTSGVQMMLLATIGPGDTVIVPRNCHKSVWDALVLSGARPVYVWPGYDEERDLATQVSPEDVRLAIEQNPQAGAMMIVNPSYYGLAPRLEEICSILDEHGIVSLVDEAHGTHFVFHPGLPKSAADCKADLWAQSAHKTIPALTQASYLHARRGRVDLNRLRHIHSMLTTTSPSYLLMASLDWARAYMEVTGRRETDRLLDIIADAKRKLRQLGIDTMDGYTRPEVESMDGTRLVLDLRDLGLTGFEAEVVLRRHGVQVEMADMRRLVCICTVADTQADFERLIGACRVLWDQRRQPRDKGIKLSISREMPRQEMSPKEAFYRKTAHIPLEASPGRVCAGIIGAYPPGIPAFCPGELIDKGGIAGLLEIKAMGGRLFGLTEDGLIPVLAE